MRTETGTYVLVGPPGTGKTTELARKVRDFTAWAQTRHPESWQTSVLLCSLTKAAAAEIAGRDLPLPRQQIGTLHSHAFRALGSPKIAEGELASFNREHPAYALSGAERDLDDPAWDRQTCQQADRFAESYGLLRARCTPRQLWPVSVLAFAAKWEAWKRDSGLLDFADLIDTAFEDTVCAPGSPSIICLDEAQDTSRAEHRLVRKWGLAAGHLVMTGDPDQCIYGWRGAEPDELYSESIPASHRRVLSQSYRVPRAVHRAAMAWRQRLQHPQPLVYAPREADGSVTLSPSTYRTPGSVINYAEQRLAEGRSVMIMAACGFMLGPTIHELRKRALPFSNPWRRKRGDWNPLAPRHGTSMLDRIATFLRADPGTYDAESRMWTWAELDAWTDPLAAKLLFRPGLRSQLEEFCSEHPDGVSDWQTLKTWWQEPALQDLVARLMRAVDPAVNPREATRGLLAWWRARLLTSKADRAGFALEVVERHGLDAARKEPRLFIGSIHSFKGSEADCVVIFPDISPAGWREWANPATRDSVCRLFYVALTRAREELVLCQPCGPSVPLSTLMGV